MSVPELENLDLLLDLSDRALVQISLAGKVLKLNKKAKELLGIQVASFYLGKSVATLVKEYSSKSVLENFKIENIVSELKNKPVYDFNGRDSIKETEVKWKCRSLIQEEELHSVLLVGKVVNKEKNLANKELAEIKDYYEKIIALMPGHVYWQDKNGVYLGCNEQQATYIGLKSYKDIVNKTNQDLPWNLFAEEIARLDEVNAEVVRTQIPRTIEAPVTLLDGTEAVFLTKIHPLKDIEGDVIGVLGIAIDITERKRAEATLIEAKQQVGAANQVKADFMACMSHDLRTPLNGIVGAIQVLQMNKHLPEQQEFLQNVRQSANNLLYLVEDVLAFAKLESGKQELCAEAFDMRKLVEEVVTLVAHQAQQKGIKLIISYCDTVPHHLISDPNVMRRILINLVGNAIKFTNSGHVLISVDLVETEMDEAKIQLTVEDTGVGMARKELDNIFEKFYRIAPSYSGRYQGTGLGLAIVKQLSELLGGTINVNSQPNFGSTFWCTLPVLLQSNSRYESAWKHSYSNTRVLIVDDYTVRAKNVQKQLSISINKVCQSNEAITLLKEAYHGHRPFDIVIIDDELNSIGALALARAIREKTEYDEAMLVLFSNPKSLPEKERASQAGFYQQLIKPVQPKELTSKLTEAWEQWRTEVSAKEKLNSKSKTTILLVEDDAITQSVTRALLTKLGCKVDIAETGMRGIELAKNHYDAIFMDIGLPDVDGLEVTKAIIKNWEQQGSETSPIIGLTAHVFEKNKRECLQAGMVSFLSKPVSFNELKEVIDNLTRQKKSEYEPKEVACV